MKISEKEKRHDLIYSIAKNYLEIIGGYLGYWGF